MGYSQHIRSRVFLFFAATLFLISDQNVEGSEKFILEVEQPLSYVSKSSEIIYPTKPPHIPRRNRSVWDFSHHDQWGVYNRQAIRFTSSQRMQ